MEGDTLVHTDLGPANLIVTPDGLRIVDWAMAAKAAPWVESAITAEDVDTAGSRVSDLGEGAADHCEFLVVQAVDEGLVDGVQVGGCGAPEGVDA